MPETNNILTLLVVDDSQVCRMIIEKMVHAIYPDWIILEAGSGEQALQVMEQTIPDYAIVDINMPGISGIDLTKRLLEQSQLIKVAILSANIQESTRRKVAELGVEFFAKPVTKNLVSQILRYFEG